MPMDSIVQGGKARLAVQSEAFCGGNLAEMFLPHFSGDGTVQPMESYTPVLR